MAAKVETLLKEPSFWIENKKLKMERRSNRAPFLILNF
jgi:hypothetical protein